MTELFVACNWEQRSSMTFQLVDFIPKPNTFKQRTRVKAKQKQLQKQLKAGKFIIKESKNKANAIQIQCKLNGTR